MRNAIQILIVVLILLTCGGMLAPAIVKVREAAALSQCTNNLMQLGQAVHNYAGTYNGRFPGAAMPNPDLLPEKRLSWIVATIPFVEGTILFNKMEEEKAWDAEENRYLALTDVKLLQCPAYPERPSVSTLAPSDYLGIAGVGADAIALPAENSRAGFFGYERSIKMEDLKDRTGSVLIIAETSEASGAWTAAGTPTTRGLLPNDSAYIGAGGQFGGNHRGGANVAFVDGSVRLIEKSIDPAVWEAMATLSGKGNQE